MSEQKEITKHYSNGEVTIIWKPHLCIHSGNCVRGLPAVFRSGERPWIRPEGAGTDAMIDQVKKCPSGALSYRMNKEVDEDPMLQFESLSSTLLKEEDVERGKMMREPALKCRDKVFCFYWAEKETMGFELGKGFDIENTGVKEYSFLSPFKNKPPMYAWYLVSSQELPFWPSLAKIALDRMRTS